MKRCMWPAFDRWLPQPASKRAEFLLRLTWLALAALGPCPGYAAEFDPRGIYFNSFSGQFSGTEWLQVRPASDGNRLLITDVRGGGFDAHIDGDGSVSFERGSGSFDGGDRFTLFPFGGAFTFRAVRAAF